jgi:hypothetical protein
MSQYSAPATLTTPGGTITFNPVAGGSGYYLTNAPGLAQAPLRAPIDAKPQTGGAIIHPFLKDARHPTIEGFILPVVGPTLVSMMDALVVALESIEQADGSWSWTDDGAALKTITVRCEIAVDYAGARPKTYTFGLVAGDPTIT